MVTLLVLLSNTVIIWLTYCKTTADHLRTGEIRSTSLRSLYINSIIESFDIHCPDFYLNVSETEFCLLPQEKITQLDPIDRDSLHHWICLSVRRYELALSIGPNCIIFYLRKETEFSFRNVLK
jgi:hypothetical protein